MNWFYVEAGQQRGPVSEADLENLFKTGVVRGDTLVWHEGMPEWTPYAKAKPAAANPGAPAGVPLGVGNVVCSECKGIFSPDQVVKHGSAYVCATCKPIFLQKLKEGTISPGIMHGSMEYGGFWIRVAAKILDQLIVSVPLLIVFGIVFAVMFSKGKFSALGSSPVTMGATQGGFESVMTLVQIVFQCGAAIFGILYNVFFLTKYGATPGKMICGLKVVTADGEKLTVGRATGRAFAEILSGIICYIGYIIVGFDEQKRALHDHICNTRVVRK
jgi:uncharacterized RDD family membrane protein YckC